MRLLLASDIHRDLAAAQSLCERSSEVDVVVVAGDLGTMRRGHDETIDVLSAIQKPTILVPGNNESLEELRDGVEKAQWSSAHALHGTGVEIAGQAFFGLGGGIPITPFGDWSWDLSEDDARRLLGACPANAVLVSHSPPKGLGDLTSVGVHVGSLAVLETISERKPRLIVCGHIHDSWGFDQIEGDTRVINAGPRAVVVEL